LNIKCDYFHLCVLLVLADFLHLCCLVFDNCPYILQIPGGNSWLYNLISTIIGNLKVTISNVHIRYEDSARFAKINDNYPFSCFGCILFP
jgi:hypothetical protein